MWQKLILASFGTAYASIATARSRPIYARAARAAE